MSLPMILVALLLILSLEKALTSSHPRRLLKLFYEITCNFYGKDALNSASNNEHFWCTYYTNKINFYSKEAISSDRTEKSHVSCFSRDFVKKNLNILSF